jgi:hypothetical protein
LFVLFCLICLLSIILLLLINMLLFLFRDGVLRELAEYFSNYIRTHRKQI